MHAASGAWGHEVSSIRVVVKIPASIYPELLADLAKVDLRDRAERLRMLAMLGLRDSQHHALPPPADPKAMPQQAPRQDPSPKQVANKLIRNLARSL